MVDLNINLVMPGPAHKELDNDWAHRLCDRQWFERFS